MTSFPQFQPDKIIRSAVNTTEDPILKKLTHVSMAPIFRDERTQKRVEESEYIDSYLNALKAVRDMTLKQTKEQDPIVRMFKTRSLAAIPLIFLGRHVVELTLKNVLIKQGKQPKKIHEPKKLWKDAEVYCRQELPDDQISSINEFIEFLNGLDPQGTRFRYSARNEDSPVDNLFTKIQWLDPDLFTTYVESLVSVFRQVGLIPQNPIEDFIVKKIRPNVYEITSKKEVQSGDFIPYQTYYFQGKQPDTA